jgi:putative transposase
VLGIWVQASEGAKFWAGVCAELRNRGVRDVLVVCCDCEDDQAPSRAVA